jgi:hypothetical protein
MLKGIGNMALNYGISQGGFNSIEGMEDGAGDTANNALAMMNNLMMAMGGTVPEVPVEVEGEEVAETPDGQLMKFKGPKHEQGGIDADLPAGTEIFSERIKLDGESMAKRKEKRENRMKRLKSKLKKTPHNTALKNTIKRTNQIQSKEEGQDMDIQEMMKQMVEIGQESVEKFATGGIAGSFRNFGVGAVNRANPLPQVDNNILEELLAQETATLFPEMELNPANKGANVFEKLGAAARLGVDNIKNLPETEPLTPGDAIGMAGTLYSTFRPMENTRANRAGDSPNPNFYENFGQDALATNDAAKGYLNDIEAEKMRDLNLAEMGARRRGRNASRGVNQMRGNDLATFQTAGRERANVRNQTAAQMIQLLAQESQLENQRDQLQMAGEQQADIANRQDRDNFFSQLATDISTKGRGIQEIGKDLNDVKQRAVINTLLGQLSKYGITIDDKGNLITKPKGDE